MVKSSNKNRKDINTLYLCQLCGFILREPCQLLCDHRLCKICTENTKGNIIKCTQCDEETPKHKIKIDQGFRDIMKSLSIPCLLCQWNGLYTDYEEHLKSFHQNLMCELCDEIFDSTTRLDEHKQKECTKIIVPCALKEYGCLDSVS
ncbi:unnamed protein product [Rotaria sp. Silwood1]|nr:unnamed protein product [Rotaria sp. Silwood1]CAF1688186.1 unnamed protein product [Rotaria sp. Silwood1]